MNVSNKMTVGRFSQSCKQGIFKAATTASLAAAAMMTLSGTAQAANWLMLQGTSPAKAPRVKVWGFIQPTYQQDFSDANPQGTYVPPKLIGPNLDDQSAFNIQRARLAVRGRVLPHSNKIDYFLMTALGNSGITNGGSNGHYRPHVTDASVTLNYIPGARVRVGLFKTPGAEEGLQSVFAVKPYINFTSVTNQLLLERFPAAGDMNRMPQRTPNANLNTYSEPVAAFRDVGVEVFDAFDIGNWEHSYAVMVGNGHGLQLSDNNNSKDYYLYWSSAYLFNKKAHGAFRPSLKFFAWYQGGKRTNIANAQQRQNRRRYGLGVTYRKSQFRAKAEYMWGQGMIFQGPQKPLAIFNDSRASGGYVEGGWYVPKTPWELDLRYDIYQRNENQPSKAIFRTVTAGVQYHFTKVDRVTLNYAYRNFSADASKIENQLNGVKGRLSLEVTIAY